MAEIRVGTAAAITGGGPTQALSPSGMSATPKFSLIEMTSCLTAGTVADHAVYAIGATDGTTQRAMGVQCEDGALSANADCRGRYDTDAVVDRTADTTNTLDAKAAHSSFGAGTHTISWSDFPAAASLVKFVEIGGTDVSVAFADYASATSDGGVVSVSGLSFAPNMVIVYGRPTGAFANDTTWQPETFTLGYAVKTAAGAIEQFCFTDQNADQNSISTNGRSIFFNNRCAGRISATADQTSLELTAWNSGGADFTLRGAGAQQITVVMAFLKLPRSLRAMVPGLVTSTTGNKDVTGVGFQPYGYFNIATSIPTAGTGTSGAEHSKWSHGCVDDNAAKQVCIGGQVEDGAGTSDTRSIVSTTQFARVLDDAGGDTWSATHVSFLSDGVRVNVDVNSPTTDRQVGFVFWSADETTLVQGETVTISDAQVLVKSSLQVDETVTISESNLLIRSAMLVDETVTISESNLLVRSSLQVDETVTISDEAILQAENLLAVDETVTITDGAAFFADSNAITMVVDETVTISDGMVAFISALETDETVEILEQLTMAGSGVGVIANEDVTISDAVAAYLGSVLETAETVTITDDAGFGEGLIPTKSGPGIGGTAQGGAELGKTYQGGASYGGTE